MASALLFHFGDTKRRDDDAHSNASGYRRRPWRLEDLAFESMGDDQREIARIDGVVIVRQDARYWINSPERRSTEQPADVIARYPDRVIYIGGGPLQRR